jgi:DNA-binding NarL/FixJ family response regulator
LAARGQAQPTVGFRELKEKSMGRVVALMDDLFFQMKVAETAKHLGVEFKVATTAEALDGLLESPTKLLIVDLNARSAPVATIERLRATQKDLSIVAFLSHVQTELAAQARAAGCSEVMPRSAFTQNLASIIARAKD